MRNGFFTQKTCNFLLLICILTFQAFFGIEFENLPLKPSFQLQMKASVSLDLRYTVKGHIVLFKCLSAILFSESIPDIFNFNAFIIVFFTMNPTTTLMKSRHNRSSKLAFSIMIYSSIFLQKMGLFKIEKMITFRDFMNEMFINNNICGVLSFLIHIDKDSSRTFFLIFV